MTWRDHMTDRTFVAAAIAFAVLMAIVLVMLVGAG